MAVKQAPEILIDDRPTPRKEKDPHIICALGPQSGNVPQQPTQVVIIGTLRRG
jgi:hypothetical protein